MALAKKLLLSLQDKNHAVGVSPLCRAEESADGSEIEDLAALQTTLDVISVVGKVSSLFAWVRASFLAIALAPWLLIPWSMRTWSWLCPQSWHSCASPMA